MNRRFYNNVYGLPQNTIGSEDRFIWPLVPFLGGALVGYIAGRPQYNYTYPAYYPIYYPYYNNYYYQQPIPYSIPQQS